MSEATLLTNEALKAVLTDAVVDRGYIADVNAITIPGTYRVDMATLNKPTGDYGIIFHYQAGGAICAYQKIVGFRQSTGMIYIHERLKWTGSWSAWHNVAATKIT